MKVVLVSEVYPPRAGGAGWSTRALALGLRAAGHGVSVVTTSPGPGDSDGLHVVRLPTPRGRRRFTVPRALRTGLPPGDADVLHAQHSLSALACLDDDRARPTVVTIRDHWPGCFWSTRISQGRLCPRCGLVPMTRCVVGHVGAPRPFSWGAIPYMRWDLEMKRRALHRAGALIAVSESIATELRGLGLPGSIVVPNVVDARETRQTAESDPSFELPARFLLFVGKLEENKGARLLVPAVAAARTGLPLVVLGEGSLAHTLKFDAAAAGVPLVLRGWAHREDVLRAMGRATALVFPSLWNEPLSRVLLESLALGVPVAAMDTGGTREILGAPDAGFLVSDAGGLADAIGRIAGDDAFRGRLSEGARARSRAFAPESLIPRYEAVYRSLGRAVSSRS